MSAAIEAFQALRALPVSAAILDPAGRIVAVNYRWKEFGRRNRLRMPRSGVGANYLRYCGSDEPQMSGFSRDLGALLAGRLDFLTFIYPCDSPRRKRWFCLIGIPLALDQPAGVALLHVNLTDMLPIANRPLRRSGRAHKTARLGAISGLIERSVSETLSAQLEAMLTGARNTPPQTISSDRDAAEILARARLSRRQVEILRLLGKGKTNREIADLLFRSPNTVKLHVSAILQRLKLKSRTQAALLASRLIGLGSLASLGRSPQR